MKYASPTWKHLPSEGKGYRYVYPLAYAKDASTKVGDFEVTATVAGSSSHHAAQHELEARGYRFEKSDDGGLRHKAANFVPAGDVVLDYTPARTQSVASLRHWSFDGPATSPAPTQSREGDPEAWSEHRRLNQDTRPYTLISVRPTLPGWTEYKPRHQVLLVDSSQSMVGESFKQAIELTGLMIAEMDRRDLVTVVACDLRCVEFENKDSGSSAKHPSLSFAKAAREWLQRRGAAGSSNLVGSLRDTASLLSSIEANQRQRVITYIGDGMISVGRKDPSSLRRLAQKLSTHQETTVHTVSVGADADAMVLRSLARNGGGHHIAHIPGERTVNTAWRALGGSYGVTLKNIEIDLPEGVESALPAKGTFPNLRAGQDLAIAARLSSAGEGIRGPLTIRGTIAGKPWSKRYNLSIDVSRSSGNAFVPKLWAIKEIEALTESDSKRSRIVALSKAFSVLSRETSMLVLESEAMFKAFGVDRNTGAPQWTGEQEADEGSADEGAIVPSIATSGDGNSIGSSLGLKGTGRGGGGNRSGGLSPNDPLAGLDGLGTAAPKKAKRRPTARRSREREAPSAASMADSLAEEDAEAPFEPSQPSTPSQPRASTERKQEFAPEPPGPSDSSAKPMGPVETITPPQRTTPRQRGRWMKKVWIREGSIRSDLSISSSERQAVAEARRRLHELPDSRDRHRDLVRALSRAGDLNGAEKVARDWVKRDRLDPEALTYLSDAVGRLGRREEALRLLSGVVDLQTDNVVLQRRLARALQRAAMNKKACGHWFMIGSLEGATLNDYAFAVQCERSSGTSEGEESWIGLAEANEKSVRRRATVRSQIEESIAREKRAQANPKGELLLKARWSGDEDIDLSIITPQGTRISWMGGRTSAVGKHAFTFNKERLGLKRAAVGNYIIEVNRARSSRNPVQGEVQIEVLGQRKKLRFQLAAKVKAVKPLVGHDLRS